MILRIRILYGVRVLFSTGVYESGIDYCPLCPFWIRNLRVGFLITLGRYAIIGGVPMGSEGFLGRLYFWIVHFLCGC